MLKHMMTAGLLAVSATASGMAQDTLEIDISSFDSVEINNGVRVVMDASGAPGVRLEGDSADFDELNIDVHGGRLEISRDVNWFGRTPSVDVIVYVSGGQADHYKISRGATADITNIDVDQLEIDVSTGAEVDFSGQCGELEMDTSTGAVADASELACQIVDVSGSTGSSARVHAASSVRGRARMGASVRVYGGPNSRDLSSAMGGSIRVDSPS